MAKSDRILTEIDLCKIKISQEARSFIWVYRVKNSGRYLPYDSHGCKCSSDVILLLRVPCELDSQATS